ncbi:hypothetical protein HOLleu_36470 [Holothuria leucospilota]|uniref:Uncharacterized protein n=1 Tax=Holothuria leucospilota TaxID=206669 RepID=A0A9Q1BG21_HOLLE|nr:hypothetical protein HOLleu_36470 [Holothuria leucospilota]
MNLVRTLLLCCILTSHVAAKTDNIICPSPLCDKRGLPRPYQRRFTGQEAANRERSADEVAQGHAGYSF